MQTEMVSCKNDNYHNGFYADRAIKHCCVDAYLNSIPFEDWMIIPQDEPIDSCPYSSAHCFLHGSCNLFAVVLHQLYGYELYEIKSHDVISNHWYAVSTFKGKTAYIDVRGITTDFDEFFEEFKCCFGNSYYCEQKAEEELIIQEDWSETGFLFAHYIIKESNGLYRILN